MSNPADVLGRLFSMADRQSAFVLLTKMYIASSFQRRAELIESWPFDNTWQVPPRDRCTFRIGEPFSPEDRIKARLVVYSMRPEWKQLYDLDYRDVMVDIARNYHSARIVQIDADELFREIAGVSVPAAAQWLVNFADRNPDDKSMAAFCLRTYVNSDGEIGLRG